MLTAPRQAQRVRPDDKPACTSSYQAFTTGVCVRRQILCRTPRGSRLSPGRKPAAVEPEPSGWSRSSLQQGCPLPTAAAAGRTGPYAARSSAPCLGAQYHQILAFFLSSVGIYYPYALNIINISITAGSVEIAVTVEESGRTGGTSLPPPIPAGWPGSAGSSRSATTTEYSRSRRRRTHGAGRSMRSRALLCNPDRHAKKRFHRAGTAAMPFSTRAPSPA